MLSFCAPTGFEIQVAIPAGHVSLTSLLNVTAPCKRIRTRPARLSSLPLAHHATCNAPVVALGLRSAQHVVLGTRERAGLTVGKVGGTRAETAVSGRGRLGAVRIRSHDAATRRREAKETRRAGMATGTSTPAGVQRGSTVTVRMERVVRNASRSFR